MTQYGYEPLSPEDSGSTLLERVNGVVPALLTNHKGAARPGYVQPGMMWIDDSGATWLLNLYDGADDVAFAMFDPATHTVALAGGDALKRANNLSDLLDAEAARGNLHLAAGALAEKALSADVVAGADDEKFTTSAGVHSAIAAALGALNLGGAVPKAIRDFGSSGSYIPTAGTKFIVGILVGGSGGGNTVYVTGGGAGGVGFFFAAVSDAQTYPVTVGGGGGAAGSKNNYGGTGGTTSIVIDGVTYYAAGGGGAKDGGGNGGVPSSTCLTGQAGAAGGWYLAGGVYGYGTGAAAGVSGRATFLEFGS